MYRLVWLLGGAISLYGGELWRIIDLTTSVSQIDYRDAAELAARKAALGYNAEHLDIMGMPGGLSDEHFYFRSSLASRQNPDFLRQYVPEAKKRGIQIFIYFNVHWYAMGFAEKHPDWRQIREDGTPVDGVYETGSDFCVNSPWRKWCFQILRELAAYDIEGIFYDGPIYRADTCYCSHCQKKFHARHGKPLPSKKNRQGREFQELIAFQADSLADFMRDSRAVLDSVKPGLKLYMNGGVRGGNWATARLNRVLVKEQDLLGSEGGFIAGDLTRVPLWKPGLTARLLETQAGGKPTVIFSAASHKPWTFSILPDAELRLLYADTIANGASVWMGITPFEFEQKEMETIAAMNPFLARNGEYYRDTRSAAKVAIVWSDTTANFYAGADAQMIDINKVPNRSAVGNLDGEFNGLSDALMRAQTPFDVIDDETLEREGLERYQVIFLPNVACMSEKAAGRVAEWVRQGGNLFATFETSLYDETGVRRAELALGKVFGVTSRQRIVGPTAWDFMKPQASHGLTRGIERELIASPHYHLEVRPAGAEVLWRYTVPLKGRYDGVPAVSDDPALTVHRFGKGTVVYFSGDLGGTLATFHIPELMTLVRNAAEQLSARPFRLWGAPSSVEVVWRQQGEGRYLLHLVNFTGEMTRPIQAIVPLEKVRVSFASGFQPRAVRTLMRPRVVPITTGAGGQVEVTVPRIDEYEVLVIER